MTDTFSLPLFQYNDDEATEALLDSANSVDTDRPSPRSSSTSIPL